MNDQPLSVELLEEPKATDIAFICTNLRTIDGKKPVFIDFAASTFLFPMSMVRFVEIPQAGAEHERNAGLTPTSEASEPEDLDIDEDFLRRVREA